MEKIDLRDYHIAGFGGKDPIKEMEELQKKLPEFIIKPVIREHANGGHFFEYYARLRKPRFLVALSTSDIKTMLTKDPITNPQV